ncbi:hypothetical protein [Bdellovibrio bacteriovorus]|uniref:hypothetical protein n=1 Tax=Bdellovibrio bacteriovorus TaxID=959 RepID=UPI0035A5873F
MRSHPFVKRTLPCLAVIVALGSASPAYAQTNFFGKLKSAATHFINAATKAGGPAKVVQPETSADSVVQEKKPFSVEADVIAKVIKSAQNASFGSNDLRRAASAVAEKVAVVNTETHTEIIPEYNDKGLVFRFRYDDKALQNPELLMKDLAVVAHLTKALQTEVFTMNFSEGAVRSEIESPHSIAELIMNAREGSPSAKARLNFLEARILRSTSLWNIVSINLNLSSNEIANQAAALESKQEALDSEAQKHIRKQQKALDAWKAQTGTLDKFEAMQEKLDDLILKNDRKGVRQMLEAYLPWAVMEPVEANTWKIWLEAIEHPDLSKTTIAFRGLKYDTDKIQRKQTAHGEVYGFMSTVLTKNQGSYTRRLRSLSTNREKNGDVSLKFLSKPEMTKTTDVMSVRITDQMTSHAKDPKASSFISFTYDPSVAMRFMGQDIQKHVKGETVTVPYGGMLVVKMDSRRMIPNIPSMYGNEIELLAPLIVFPDEVVEYKEGSFKQGEWPEFIKKISDKTGVDFTNWHSAKDANDEGLKQRYNREGHEFLKQMTEMKSLKGMSCSKVF